MIRSWKTLKTGLATLALGIGLCSAATIAFAQNTAAVIAGSVVDSTGAAIPQAQVTLLDNDTNIARASDTNSTGNYEVGQLQPGHYTLTVTR
ncbi:MAG: carboxypeptidase regulatory-like domain-containing protein, partial [Acidobacteria bacterium]|nr:carboxypeptidase regulatory-like domain-containing protein [Acidobacteriota bacterium]